mgnify:FL=1
MLVFAVCASAIHAQTTTELLQKAEKACMMIRNAVTARSADDVMAGMEMISEIPFSELALNSVDTKSAVPMRGHLQYNVEYLDELLLKNLDMGLIKVEDAYKMRATGTLLKCTHRAVAAGGSVTYSMMAQGEQSLLVVPECGGKINLYVNDKGSGRKLTDKADGGKDCCSLNWTIERAGELLITVENKSNKDLSFIIVSN